MNTSTKGQQAPSITLRTRTSTSSQTPPSTPRGSIGTTWRHRMAHKPQWPSSKRCQSRQPVSISTVVVGSRAHIAGLHHSRRRKPRQTVPIRVEVTEFRRRHHTQSPKQHSTAPTPPKDPLRTQRTYPQLRISTIHPQFSPGKHKTFSPTPRLSL